MPTTIADESRGSAGLTIVAVVFTVFTILALLSRARLMTVVFAVLAALFIFGSVQAVMRGKRFSSQLVLADDPVPIGGVMRGTVEVSSSGAPLLTKVQPIRVKLVSILRTPFGRSTRDSIVWREQVDLSPASLRMTANGVAIPIEIKIPPDAHPTDDSDRAKRYLWRLEVGAPVSGVQYYASFTVRVSRV